MLKSSLNLAKTSRLAYTVIGHFWVSHENAQFQNEAKCKTFLCDNEFYLEENKKVNHFHVNGFLASGNSEMA